MKSLAKKIIAILVLSSLLAISLFSLAIILHGPEQTMANSCPFSVLDPGLCPQNTINVVVHHLLAYHSFFNIPLITNLSLLLLASLLLLFSPWWIISPTEPILSLPLLNRILSEVLPKQRTRQKISRWLALLKNSPTHP